MKIDTFAATAARLSEHAQRSDEYLEQLQSEVKGRVILRHDAGYDAARRGWNLTIDQRPALIVAAAEAPDVAAAVRYARHTGLGIAVQSTGHGVARAADDALLILTSALTGIRIDAGAQTAWVGAGAQWGMVLEAAQQHGLAPLLGSSPNVGVVGYTLGGGMGWLARKHGLALDSVLAFEVVTAEGRALRVSERENAELFWGMRGGSGSLAIVTAMQIRLYPVTTVYGGNLFYPAAMAKEVFARYRDWVETLPDEMTSSVVLMNFPPVPAVPEPLRGQSMVMVRGCYAGPVEEGERLVDAWRTWRTPAIDLWTVMPFTQVATISNDPVDPMPAKSTGAWLNGLSDASIDALVAGTLPQQGPPILTFTELRHAGGAIAKADAHGAAFSHRDGRFNMVSIGVTPTPDALAAFAAHMDALKAAIAPDLHGGVYLNFLDGEEMRQRTREAFSAEHYARLVALKATVDPRDRLAYSLDLRPEPAVA